MNKKLIKILTGVLVISLIMSCTTTEAKKDETDPVVIELQNQVDALNQTLPIEVSPGIRLDKVAVESNRTMVYKSTMLNVVSSEAINFDVDKAKAAIINSLYDSDPDTAKSFIDNDITLKYVYFTKKAKKIAEVIINPEDWKKLK